MQSAKYGFLARSKGVFQTNKPQTLLYRDSQSRGTQIKLSLYFFTQQQQKKTCPCKAAAIPITDYDGISFPGLFSASATPSHRFANSYSAFQEQDRTFLAVIRSPTPANPDNFISNFQRKDGRIDDSLSSQVNPTQNRALTHVQTRVLLYMFFVFTKTHCFNVATHNPLAVKLFTTCLISQVLMNHLNSVENSSGCSLLQGLLSMSCWMQAG